MTLAVHSFGQDDNEGKTPLFYTSLICWDVEKLVMITFNSSPIEKLILPSSMYKFMKRLDYRNILLSVHV